MSKKQYHSANRLADPQLGRHKALLRTSVAVIALTIGGAAYAANTATLPITADGVVVGPVEVDISVPLGSAGVRATNSGFAIIDGGTVTGTGDRNHRTFGLLALNGGVISSRADVFMIGDRAHAVQAGGNGTGGPVYDGSTAGVIGLSGGLITTYGDYAVGLHAVDGGVITADGTHISTGGPNSPAVHAESNSLISLSNVVIGTHDVNSHGVLANNNRVGANGGQVDVTNSAITTSGAWSHGVYASEPSSVVNLAGGQITTTGERSYGLLADTGGAISGGTAIVTAGLQAHGVQAGKNGTSHPDYGLGAGTIDLKFASVTTAGDKAVGLHAVDAGVLSASSTSVRTSGDSGFGAHSESLSQVHLTNVAIETSGANGLGVVVNNDAGTSVGGFASVTGGSIQTVAAWSHGVVASDGGSAAELAGVAIRTTGERSYGLLASHAAKISGSADILTTGLKAHGVQAGFNGTGATDYGLGAGSVVLSGGSVSTHGESAVGMHAVDGGAIIASGVGVSTTGASGFGVHAESLSRVDLDSSSIQTSGANAHGVVANNDLAGSTGGVVNLANTNIAVSGSGAHGVISEHGAQVNINGGSIAATGAEGAGIVMNGGSVSILATSVSSQLGAGIENRGSGSVNVAGSSVQGGTTALSQVFTGADQISNIVLGSGTNSQSAGGVLLSVDRTAAGGETGAVTLTLANGSISQGDILDLGVKTSGFTDVDVGGQASWTGVAKGVRNLVSHQTGGTLNFEAGSVIGGDLSVSGSNLVFGPGVVIGGSVGLANGSRSTGGTIDLPITVGGDVVADASSRMGGNWYVRGNLQNLGAIAPGNSIGIVTVGGNFVQSASSVYQVEINGAGQSDQIRVGGVATLGGRVEVSPYPANGGYLIGTRYAIVSAAGGLGGSTYAGGVTWTGAALPLFIAPALTYDANNAYVTIGRSGVSMASVALTPNQAAAAGAIDRLPVTNALFNAVAFQATTQGARQAFDALSGEAHASLAGALVEESHVVRDAVNNRLRQAFGGPVSAATSAQTKALTGLNATIWGQAFGSWGHSSSPTTAKADRSSAGFLAGVDAPVMENLRLGVAAGYSRTSVDVDQRLSSSSADSYHLALYGGSQFGALGLRFGAAYTWNDATVNRAIVFPGFADSARSSYRSGIAQVFGEASYAARFGATSVEPFLNVAWVNLDSDRFAEFGGAAALQGKGSDMNTAFTTLGARIAHTFEVGNGFALTARGTIGWRHAFGDVDPRSWMSLAGGASSFTVTGAPIARNSLLLETGLDLTVAPNVSVGVSWTGQIAERVQDNSVKGNFTVRF